MRIPLLFCLYISFFAFKPSYGQILSDEGLQVFWQTMKQIETGETVSEEDWQRLWSTPGFNFWMDTERGQQIFYNYYTLVFDPSLKDSLEQEISQSRSARRIIFDHLIEAGKKRSELSAFANDLKRSNIIEKARWEAFAYLPDTLSVANDSTLVALMIFQPDAFAVSEENLILLDALYAYNYGEGFEKFLGHEFHHIYLSKYISRLKEIDGNSEYFPLIWSINKLRMEGIADLIDKDHIMEEPPRSDYDRKYREHYKASKTHLQKIDSLLQLIARDQILIEEWGKQIRRELPISAHPTGLYIAHIIKKKYGREGILKCLKSPFSFLYIYNDIARKSQGEYHVFSSESITYLKKLEQEFIE